ncbi:MAG: hypothetical protein U5L07_06690 [Desulfobacterales bacterium]|nr:hypothetical protein [Desulfobacterales bacterium]
MEVTDECAGCGTCKKGVCFTVGNLTPVARCEQFAIETKAKEITCFQAAIVRFDRS